MYTHVLLNVVKLIHRKRIQENERISHTFSWSALWILTMHLGGFHGVKEEKETERIIGRKFSFVCIWDFWRYSFYAYAHYYCELCTLLNVYSSSWPLFWHFYLLITFMKRFRRLNYHSNLFGWNFVSPLASYWIFLMKIGDRCFKM